MIYFHHLLLSKLIKTIYRADYDLITSRWSRFSWASRASWHARHTSTSLRSTFTYWMIIFIPCKTEMLTSEITKKIFKKTLFTTSCSSFSWWSWWTPWPHHSPFTRHSISSLYMYRSFYCISRRS